MDSEWVSSPRLNVKRTVFSYRNTGQKEKTCPGPIVGTDYRRLDGSVRVSFPTDKAELFLIVTE